MWVFFDLNESPAPSLGLPSAIGEQIHQLAPVGDRNRALFFAHSMDCADCLETIRHLAASRKALEEQNAQALVILPQATAPPSAEALANQGILFLIDEEDQARRSYTSLFEFDPPGDLMLFLLDRNGAPFRAWIGQEAEGQALIDDSLRHLESLELRCPE